MAQAKVVRVDRQRAHRDAHRCLARRLILLDLDRHRPRRREQQAHHRLTLAPKGRRLKLVARGVTIEAEIERVGRGVKPVEVPLELKDAVMRIEPHRLDQVEHLAFPFHEGSLEQALGPFIAWLAVHDKPRSEPEPGASRPARPLQGADQHVEGSIAARLDPPHRPGVSPARLAFEPPQRLDRGDLGGPGDRSARKDRRQHIDRVEPVPETRANPADHLVKRRIRLDLEQLGHLDAPCLRHTRQIVAHQIDDHQIFRALLGIGRKRRHLGGIGHQVGVARRGALHRPGFDHAVADGEELFGRQRQDVALAIDDHPAPSGRRRAPQPRVQRQRIARHRDIAAKGQIGLIVIPREQMLAHFARRRFIGRALDPRARGPGERSVGRGEQVGEIRDVKSVVQAERHQRPVAVAHAGGQFGVECMPRFIGQPPRRMRAVGNAGADPFKRWEHRVSTMSDDCLARRAVQSRARPARARIVEQDPHRRCIALGRSGS